MKLTCGELFTIFEKVGGKFICDYEKNEGRFLPQNIKCNHLDLAATNIDSLLMAGAYVHSKIVKEIPNTDNKIIKKVHHYQKKDVKEIHIEFQIDADGFIEPVEK